MLHYHDQPGSVISPLPEVSFVRAYKTFMAVALGLAVVSCGPANNGVQPDPATAPKAPSAPTVDQFVALEHKADEAYFTGDTQTYETLLSDKMIMTEGEQRLSKGDLLKIVRESKCEVKPGWTLTAPHLEKINNDTYVLVHIATMEASCTFNGKTDKQPSPVRAATLWLRNGENWQAAYYGENLIVDPKTLARTLQKEDTKKGPAKKGGASDSAAQTADLLTIEVLAAEREVWEAWKDKDAKKIEGLTAADLSFVNIFGTAFTNKADAIKDWTSHTCDARSVTLTNGRATLISPGVAFLTVTGTVDGTCGGQKPPTAYAHSVYVKDGAGWKWAFGFNSPR
jgi:uncharacterized protein DUF4440